MRPGRLPVQSSRDAGVSAGEHPEYVASAILHSIIPQTLNPIHRVLHWPRRLVCACEGYMRDKLGVPADEVTSLCLSAYTNFGTTMAGLVVRVILAKS